MEELKEVEKKSVSTIDLAKKTYLKLQDNNINTLGELCKNTKSQLRKFGLTQKEIIQVEVRVQLQGVNLKNR